MTEQNKKYLIHDNSLIHNAKVTKKSKENPAKREGIEGQIAVVQRILSNALAINRIAIINSIKQSSVHNFGRIDSYPASKYLDLDKTEVYKIGENGILKKQSLPIHWISEEDFFRANLHLKKTRKISEQQLYDAENEKYTVLALLQTRSFPYYMRMIASQVVNDLTDTVLRCFGTSRAAMSELQNLIYNRCDMAHLFEKIHREKFFYSCLHVRANDMLLEIPHYFRAAQVKQIKDLVHSACPLGTKLYIMSDIHTPGYFDFLKDEYDVYRYYDFPELKQLISETNRCLDNNMLFMVERNIMDHAIVQIRSPSRDFFHFQSNFSYRVPYTTQLHYHALRYIKGRSIMDPINRRIKNTLLSFKRSLHSSA